jgi:hypothetical protein
MSGFGKQKKEHHKDLEKVLQQRRRKEKAPGKLKKKSCIFS